MSAFSGGGVENQMKAAVSETELWRRFRGGDADAFSLIYDMYADSLFRYGMKITSDKETVLDSIHDIFLKLYRRRPSEDSVRSPKFYLFKAFRGQIYDNLKTRNKLPSVAIDEIPFSVEWRLSADAGAEKEHEDEILEKYRQALAAMTARQKEAVYLHYTMGLSFEECSALMDMNIQSLRNLISRAVGKIRRIMPFSVFLLHFV